MKFDIWAFLWLVMWTLAGWVTQGQTLASAAGGLCVGLGLMFFVLFFADFSDGI